MPLPSAAFVNRCASYFKRAFRFLWISQTCLRNMAHFSTFSPFLFYISSRLFLYIQIIPNYSCIFSEVQLFVAFKCNKLIWANLLLYQTVSMACFGITSTFNNCSDRLLDVLIQSKMLLPSHGYSVVFVGTQNKRLLAAFWWNFKLKNCNEY